MSNKVSFPGKKVVDIQCPPWCRHPRRQVGRPLFSQPRAANGSVRLRVGFRSFRRSRPVPTTTPLQKHPTNSCSCRNRTIPSGIPTLDFPSMHVSSPGDVMERGMDLNVGRLNRPISLGHLLWPHSCPPQILSGQVFGTAFPGPKVRQKTWLKTSVFRHPNLNANSGHRQPRCRPVSGLRLFW